MISAQRKLGASGDPLLEPQTFDSAVYGATTERVSFPIYDGHGNMIETIARNGAGFTLANKKTYDVWGKVRSDAGAGGHVVNPNTKYCANLGHKYDEGTELTYMRARYYEAATGRFISEDPAHDGSNWYAYCGNDPVNFTDATGEAKSLAAAIGAMVAGFLGYLIGQSISQQAWVQVLWTLGSSVFTEAFVSNEVVGEKVMQGAKRLAGAAGRVSLAVTRSAMRGFVSYVKAMEKMFDSLPPPGGIGMAIIMATAAYAGAIYAELFLQDLEV